MKYNCSLIFTGILLFARSTFADIDVALPEMKRSTVGAPETSNRAKLLFSLSSFAPSLDSNPGAGFDRSHIPSMFFGLESAPLISFYHLEVSAIAGLQPTLLEREISVGSNLNSRTMRQNIFLLSGEFGLNLNVDLGESMHWLSPFMGAHFSPTWGYREKKGTENERQFFGIGTSLSAGFSLRPKEFSPIELTTAARYTFGKLEDYSLSDLGAEVGLKFSL